MFKSKYFLSHGLRDAEFFAVEASLAGTFRACAQEGEGTHVYVRSHALLWHVDFSVGPDVHAGGREAKPAMMS